MVYGLQQLPYLFSPELSLKRLRSFGESESYTKPRPDIPSNLKRTLYTRNEKRDTVVVYPRVGQFTMYNLAVEIPTSSILVPQMQSRISLHIPRTSVVRLTLVSSSSERIGTSHFI
jgi:hypothetical protein